MIVFLVSPYISSVFSGRRIQTLLWAMRALEIYRIWYFIRTGIRQFFITALDPESFFRPSVRIHDSVRLIFRCIEWTRTGFCIPARLRRLPAYTCAISHCALLIWRCILTRTQHGKSQSSRLHSVELRFPLLHALVWGIFSSVLTSYTTISGTADIWIDISSFMHEVC